MVLFIINYKRHTHHNTDILNYKYLRTSDIKSIYINENPSVMCQYADPRLDCTMVIQIFGCTVFIETKPEEEISVEGAKGVRKTWLEGYSPVKEFYSPDYSATPQLPDHRRTLYWNPSVTPDENGIAKIQFYNNSSCTDFHVNIETVTPQGNIGIYLNR